jgi:hypothetical protein
MNLFSSTVEQLRTGITTVFNGKCVIENKLHAARRAYYHKSQMKYIYYTYQPHFPTGTIIVVMRYLPTEEAQSSEH